MGFVSFFFFSYLSNVASNLSRYRTLNSELSLSNLSLAFKGPRAAINSSGWGFYKLSGTLRSSAQAGLCKVSQPRLNNIFKSKKLISFALSSNLSLSNPTRLNELNSYLLSYKIASFRSKLVPINSKYKTSACAAAAFWLLVLSSVKTKGSPLSFKSFEPANLIGSRSSLFNLLAQSKSGLSSIAQGLSSLPEHRFKKLPHSGNLNSLGDLQAKFLSRNDALATHNSESGALARSLGSFCANTSKVFFLRANELYNKGRYSRNRQTYRTGAYWCMWLTVLSVIGLYFYFYVFLIKFTYVWFLWFTFLSSFFLYYTKPKSGRQWVLALSLLGK